MAKKIDKKKGSKNDTTYVKSEKLKSKTIISKTKNNIIDEPGIKLKEKKTKKRILKK